MPTPVKWSAADFTLGVQTNVFFLDEPWLAASPDGRFSVAYDHVDVAAGFHGSMFQHFAASGDRVGGEMLVAGFPEPVQMANAFMPDGREVFAWSQGPGKQYSGNPDIYSVISFANPESAPHIVVADGEARQVDSIVAASASSFAVAFIDTSAGLVLKFYDRDGELFGTTSGAASPVNVNMPVADLDTAYRDVEITALADGNYVATWTSSSFFVWARVFSPTGIALSGVLQTEASGPFAFLPDVTALADGRFLVTYLQYQAGNVRGRIYEANGTASTGPFTIGGDGVNALNQQVQSAALNDGRFVTVWQNTAGNIQGQVVGADGTPDGSAFSVNSDGAGGKGRPTVATLADGRFAVAWESGAGDTAKVFGTIFDPREAGLAGSASSLGDDWIGSRFGDTVYMGQGNDRIAGAAGRDSLYGEAGEDTLNGDAGDDTLSGGTHNDTLDGGADNDTLNGNTGIDAASGGTGNDTFFVDAAADTVIEISGEGTADRVKASASYVLKSGVYVEVLTTTLDTGTTAINLTGNALKQDITGNAGANELSDGGAGAADVMRGLGGNDTYRVFNTGDTIVEGATAGTDDKVVAAVSYALGTGVYVEMMQTSSGAGTSAINLYGNEFAQSMIAGNNGANKLEGKGGADTLRGLGGADTFVFGTKLGGGNIDTIVDFKPIDDRFLLSDAIFTKLTPGTITADQFRANTTGEARDSTDRIIYNTDSGGIFYDADGLGGAAGVQFATVGLNLAITNADFDVV